MKKRSRIALLTALLTIVFAAGIGVYSNYIGMQIYSGKLESSARKLCANLQDLHAVRAEKLDRAEPVGQPDE